MKHIPTVMTCHSASLQMTTFITTNLGRDAHLFFSFIRELKHIYTPKGKYFKTLCQCRFEF